MGLDMYLRAKKSFYEFYGDDDKQAIVYLNSNPSLQLQGADGNIGGPEQAVHAVEVEAIYWRKANHIHKWFVDNVQEGEDDCGTYDVSVEHLAKLRDVCAEVLADRAKSKELLATQEGFFFGGTEYDEWYYGDTERTHRVLTAILAGPKVDRWDFTYHSSW